MKWLSSRRAKLGFLAPAAFLYVLFLVVPISIAVYYSFTDFTGIGAASFVGLGNYRRLLQDRGFFIAPIIVGVIWSFIFNPQFGLINSALRALGLNFLALEWIGGRSLSPVAVGIVFTWQLLGFHTTIFLAGLRMIPGEVYEAAAIDGASPARRVLRITIPMLRETITINVVLIVTGIFKIYELVVQLTGGGPNHLSEVLTSYMYFTVFTSSQYGYGMAIAVVILLFSMLGSFFYIRKSHRPARAGKDTK